MANNKVNKLKEKRERSTSKNEIRWITERQMRFLEKAVQKHDSDAVKHVYDIDTDDKFWIY